MCERKAFAARAFYNKTSARQVHTVAQKDRGRKRRRRHRSQGERRRRYGVCTYTYIIKSSSPLVCDCDLMREVTCVRSMNTESSSRVGLTAYNSDDKPFENVCVLHERGIPAAPPFIFLFIWGSRCARSTHLKCLCADVAGQRRKTLRGISERE
jgi:hypothetical protein